MTGAPGNAWHHATGVLALDRPRIFGIVNVTPDSFSDGGRFVTLDEARRHADRLIAEGADVIDVGGESTRPQGAKTVDGDEEQRRVVPVIEAVRRDHPSMPISIDTTKAAVAYASLEAGASVVNDVSALRLDDAMARVCAAAGAGVVLMHSRGDVATMATYAHATYGDDPVGEVIAELRAAADVALNAGVAADRIVLDPGVGFSKKSETSIAALSELPRLVALGYPVLVGASRKRFIGEITGVAEPSERVAGTVGANVAALLRGARVFRVHDVKPSRDALDVAWAILRSGDLRGAAGVAW
ncbi:MAG TPA: dihydropteroate synthase [Gemmatimonadaceae bacterium]|nr:dihydropteroate synthase [Gemmatimonadaceae bacterium]